MTSIADLLPLGLPGVADAHKLWTCAWSHLKPGWPTPRRCSVHNSVRSNAPSERLPEGGRFSTPEALQYPALDAHQA
jgi:hypothetical protein